MSDQIQSLSLFSAVFKVTSTKEYHWCQFILILGGENHVEIFRCLAQWVLHVAKFKPSPSGSESSTLAVT
jgi:hypothetical protein